MSSTYINNFHRHHDRKMILSVIDDMESGNSLKHFLNRYVEERLQDSPYIDWKRRYISSNYINTVLNEYIDYIQVIMKTTDQPKSGKFPKKRKDALDMFFKNNNWSSLIKNIAYNRKKYGDVYLYWFIDKDKETEKEYPKFILLDSKKVEIKLDVNKNIFAYVFQDTVYYEKEVIKGEFQSESVVKKWVFKEGVVEIFEDGILVEEIFNRKEHADLIPIIHMQFMVDVDTMYSTIPAEPLIDLALHIDSIDTSISYINAMMGSPQLYVVDGVVDKKNSGFGPNSIIYVDTVRDQDDDTAKIFQAKIGQVEITNELKSLYKEKEDYIELLFSKVNLISPKGYQLLAKSNSSKVLSASRKDLEHELGNFYGELSVKLAPIFKVLYKLNGITIPQGEYVTLTLPEYIIDETIYDKYMLKAQKMNIGELTIQENLRDIGMSDSEIKQHMDEINEEAMNGKDDISITKKSVTPQDISNATATMSAMVTTLKDKNDKAKKNTVDKQPTTKGVDNRAKQV